MLAALVVHHVASWPNGSTLDRYAVRLVAQFTSDELRSNVQVLSTENLSMRLDTLTRDLNLESIGAWSRDRAVEISDVSNNSADCRPGTLFVAIDGSQIDGHNFIPEAIRNGCSAVVVSNPAKVPPGNHIPMLRSTDTRSTLETLAVRMFGSPSSELFMIGVTGTNGKTSTTYLVDHILSAAGLSCGVIGNIDHHLGALHWDSGGTTTPDSTLLQKCL